MKLPLIPIWCKIRDMVSSLDNMRKRLLAIPAFFVGVMIAGAQAPAHFPVVEATIAGVHKALEKKTCTCEGLVQEYLQRIATYDQSTGLNSIIITNPQALESARALDAEFARTRKLRPLHCVPLIVKDNYDTRGLQTTAGSLAMKGCVPAADATMVRKLRDAGAIG